MDEKMVVQTNVQGTTESASTSDQSHHQTSPFLSAANKPSFRDPRRGQSGAASQRQKPPKPQSEQQSRQSSSAGPSRQSSTTGLSKTKSSPNVKGVAEPPKGAARGRGHDTGTRPPGLPPKVIPHTKSTPHLQKVSTKATASGLKPVSSAQKLKGGPMKRSVSWNELHLSVAPIERSPSENLGHQNPKPATDPNPKPLPSHKRLLQKVKSASNQVLEKAQAPKVTPLRLPILAPLEKRILASVGQRDWIRIDSKGEESLFKKDKHVMTHELGMQIRDLRLLDPLMTSTYPSAILFREKALVVNLEYIKCIITQDSTLILDANQPYVKAFRQQLQQRLRDKVPSHLQYANGAALSIDTSVSFSKPRFDPPYELKALETALDNVCKHLENAYVDLDQGMRPMLGTHTVSKVTSDYLERLRRLKSRLVRLKTRVETLKEVLDKILGDEGDMKAIHLSGRMRELKAAFERKLMRKSLRDFPHSPTLARQSLTTAEEEEEIERDIEEVEMLLSPYHLNLDSTLNKLADIYEFVEDSEELLSLEMDTYRNNNLRMRLGLGFMHLMGSTSWAVFNVFGMNLGEQDITAEVQPDGSDSHSNFLEVAVSTIVGPAILFFVFTLYLHSRNLSWTSIPSS